MVVRRAPDRITVMEALAVAKQPPRALLPFTDLLTITDSTMNTARTCLAALLIAAFMAGSAVLGYRYEESTSRGYVATEVREAVVPVDLARQADSQITVIERRRPG